MVSEGMFQDRNRIMLPLTMIPPRKHLRAIFMISIIGLFTFGGIWAEETVHVTDAQKTTTQTARPGRDQPPTTTLPDVVEHWHALGDPKNPIADDEIRRLFLLAGLMARGRDPDEFNRLVGLLQSPPPVVGEPRQSSTHAAALPTAEPSMGPNGYDPSLTTKKPEEMDAETSAHTTGDPRHPVPHAAALPTVDDSMGQNGYDSFLTAQLSLTGLLAGAIGSALVGAFWLTRIWPAIRYSVYFGFRVVRWILAQLLAQVRRCCTRNPPPEDPVAPRPSLRTQRNSRDADSTLQSPSFQRSPSVSFSPSPVRGSNAESWRRFARQNGADSYEAPPPEYGRHHEQDSFSEEFRGSRVWATSGQLPPGIADLVQSLQHPNGGPMARSRWEGSAKKPDPIPSPSAPSAFASNPFTDFYVLVDWLRKVKKHFDAYLQVPGGTSQLFLQLDSKFEAGDRNKDPYLRRWYAHFLSAKDHSQCFNDWVTAMVLAMAQQAQWSGIETTRIDPSTPRSEVYGAVRSFERQLREYLKLVNPTDAQTRDAQVAVLLRQFVASIPADGLAFEADLTTMDRYFLTYEKRVPDRPTPGRTLVDNPMPEGPRGPPPNRRQEGGRGRGGRNQQPRDWFTPIPEAKASIPIRAVRTEGDDDAWYDVDQDPGSEDEPAAALDDGAPLE